MPAHRDLLARHLGVEVDQHQVGVLFHPPEYAVDLLKGRARGAEVDGPGEVDHSPPDAVLLDHRVTTARVALEVVRGAEDALARVEEAVHVTVAVDVVAGGDEIDACGKQVVRRSLGYAEAAGNVLTVCDHEVRRIAFAKRRKRFDDRPASWLPDDVAQEQESF